MKLKIMTSIIFIILALTGCQSQKIIKQYDHGKLVYEGTVDKSGLRDGQGKEYSTNGVLIYEGEFHANEPNGKGVQYDPQTGKKTFDGLFRNGLMLKGTMYDKNGKNPLPYQE